MFLPYYAVSLALREPTYPFLALIVLRDSKMTVVQRIEGAIQPQDLMDRLQRVMSETEAYLVSMRHARQQRDQANTLRQQQDEAYLSTFIGQTGPFYESDSTWGSSLMD